MALKSMSMIPMILRGTTTSRIRSTTSARTLTKSFSPIRSAGSSTALFSSSTTSNSLQWPRPVYIRSMGAFLPNDPISNDKIEQALGTLEGKSSSSSTIKMVKDKILAINGIKTRYYAMKDQQPTHLNIELAVEAITDAVQESNGLSLKDIGMLATGTTMPDVPIPGFANLVHGKLIKDDGQDDTPTNSNNNNHMSMDCLSSSGVCIASTNALKAACNAIALGQHSSALVVGSEVASHGLHANFIKRFIKNNGKQDNPMSGLFLRYMLSDGAGCALLDTSPHPTNLSYRIDNFYHHSFAHRFPPCMIAGHVAGPGQEITVKDIYKFNDDYVDFALRLQQDIDLLKPNIIPLGKEALEYAMKEHGFPAEGVDWVVPHLSSYMFLPEFAEQIQNVLGVPSDRIWTNLHSVGNVGSASMPLLLRGMLKDNADLKRGDRVLVIVPESGNFSYHYVLLTVV